MQGLIEHYGLLVVVLIIYCGEIGLPTLVPGEIALLLYGSQAVHSIPELIGAMVLFAAVDILATSTIHIVSRTGGNRLLLRVMRRMLANGVRHEDTIDRWRARLGGRDALVVFVTRMIPMARLYASITTGLIRIRLRDFAAGAAPAAIVWVTIPMSLGYILRDQVGMVTGQYDLLIKGVIAASVLSVVFAAAAWGIRRAGWQPETLRRFRLILGLAAVYGVGARLLLVVLFTQPHIPGSVIGPMVAWVGVLSAVALGLVWIAAHDLRAIRMGGRGIGAISGLAWASLMVTVLASVTVMAPQHAAL